MTSQRLHRRSRTGTRRNPCGASVRLSGEILPSRCVSEPLPMFGTGRPHPLQPSTQQSPLAGASPRTLPVPRRSGPPDSGEFAQSRMGLPLPGPATPHPLPRPRRPQWLLPRR